jgi:hypothetical protein
MKKIVKTLLPRTIFWLHCSLGCLLIISSAVFTTDLMGSTTGEPVLSKESGFSLDCDNTLQRPCRKLVADYNGKPITIEPSSVAWPDRYNKAIVVSDNYNDLVQHNAGHYVIVYFGLEEYESKITVKPLFTQKQAAEFPLYDLERVTLQGDRLYTMVEVPGKPGEFYVLLGPKGYEKEEIVIAHWNTKTGQLSKTTRLPKGFVAEGVAPIAKNKLLIVDDLKEIIIIATEN